ncbi:unnamed protein product [Rhizoctonia solani]|nr:unnamed protein product [Rhizoctonia solani]
MDLIKLRKTCRSLHQFSKTRSVWFVMEFAWDQFSVRDSNTKGLAFTNLAQP